MGRARYVDMTGQTYNGIYIKGRSEKQVKGAVLWDAICPLCGKEFTARGGNIRSGLTKSCGCRHAKANHDRTFEDLTGQIFNSLYIESYYGSDKYGKNHWNARCLLCGNIIHPDTTSLKQGSSKTCGCQRMKNMVRARIVDLTGRRSGMLTAKYPVDKKDGRVLWYCECDCGGWCFESENTFMRQKATSCGCIKSRGEQRIAKWLDEHHIEYERQKTFEGCKNINPLRFDFYISSEHTVIEYDGEFHYMDINGIPNDLEQQQVNDRIKDKYCENNKIKILRIPYWEKDNIESILSEWLNIDCVEEANSLNAGLSA